MNTNGKNLSEMRHERHVCQRRANYCLRHGDIDEAIQMQEIVHRLTTDIAKASHEAFCGRVVESITRFGRLSTAAEFVPVTNAPIIVPQS